jgi:SpoVK/Ycf46/Vps4 family AAA+-type ATPase
VTATSTRWLSERTGSSATNSSLAELLPALQRLDRLLEQAVAAAQVAYGPEATAEPYRGLYIGREEVQRLLARQPGASVLWAERPEAEEPSPTLAGDMSRLTRLRQTFELSAFDVDVLLVALAPELDLRYERLYAYLQDDVTKKRPSVDLTLNLLCPSLETKLAARPCFMPDAPLVKDQLLHMFDDPSQHRPPLLGKYLKVDEQVVNYLLGSDALDARLLPYAQHTASQARLEDLLLPVEVKRRLALLIERQGRGDKGLMFYFQGPYGVGKQTTAEAICRVLGMGLFVIDGERLLTAEDTAFEVTIRLAAREALLHNAALYWAGFDALLADDKGTRRKVLVQALECQRGVTFLAGDIAWEPVDALLGAAFVRIEFPRPTYAERLQLWTTALDGGIPPEADVDLKTLANQFRFSGGQIRDAAASARNLARWRDPEYGRLTMADLYAACRLQSNRKLATLARKITPHYTWDDIILPRDRLQQLREICNYVKYRAVVYDEWGFDRKLSLGKGLNILFAGPSGTGKTMAAEIMAGELGLDLYKIDLAAVVSKYIGETEKNLARIFAEAETSNAILFFDEADALFGKRSEVRDSHDRYANIEIGYLLQRMEEYEGAVILATNLRKNMDDAFVRRMHFSVEFPFPSEQDRRRIWERVWPANSPRSRDLDLNFMARRFEMAGGNIRNIALAAAFLAAAGDGAITMAHLIHATRREYQKMGKVVTEGEFKAYVTE